MDADGSRNLTTADPTNAAPLSPLANHQSEKSEIALGGKNGSTENRVGKN